MSQVRGLSAAVSQPHVQIARHYRVLLSLCPQVRSLKVSRVILCNLLQSERLFPVMLVLLRTASADRCVLKAA